MIQNYDAIRTAILALAEACGGDKSFCPSEVARKLQPDDWRPLMKPVRTVAQKLATQGHIRITQGGHPVDPTNLKGPIRLQGIRQIK